MIRQLADGYSLRGFHFMDFSFASIRKLNFMGTF
jgi:hypothetical protein